MIKLAALVIGSSIVVNGCTPKHDSVEQQTQSAQVEPIMNDSTMTYVPIKEDGYATVKTIALTKVNVSGIDCIVAVRNKLEGGTALSCNWK